MTAMRTAQENAEENDKQIVDWELQITALNRRLTLLVSYSNRKFVLWTAVFATITTGL